MDVEKSMKETEAAFRLRGKIYYYLFDEARKEIGQEKAIAMFKRGIYRMGQEIGRHFEKYAKAGDFKGLAEAFVGGVPCEGKMFDPRIEKADADGCIIKFSDCPLDKVWKDMGLSDEERDMICDVAAALDFGTFETAGLDLEFEGRLAAGNETCTLVISKKK